MAEKPNEELVRAVGEAIFAEVKKFPTPPPYSPAIQPLGATVEDVGRAALAVVDAAGWRPPPCACEPFDVCLRCWSPDQQRESEIRQLAYCEESVQASADPEDGEQCTNTREPGSVYCEAHRRAPLPDLQRPAPRVFLPDDQVPVGTVLMSKDGSPFRVPDAHTSEGMARVGVPFVEVHVPTPEEWQAAVDRAREEREAQP